MGRIMTTAEASDRLTQVYGPGISGQTVRSWCQNDGFPHQIVGGRFLIDEDVLFAFMEQVIERLHNRLQLVRAAGSIKAYLGED